LVLVDDNPAERSIVRQLVPEVAVPELPPDPAGYIRALERQRYFELTALSAEDLRRTELYRAGAAARELEQASDSNLEDFLASLRMVARLEPVGRLTLERAAQLIGRSNQFNLTTRRHSAAQVLALSQSPEWITATVAQADRFGDHGLISVLLAQIESEVLRIDTWLMSCRVLKRGVEDLLLNHLVEVARARRLERIRGEYIPTAKNGLVREHYAKLGFELAEAGADGHTWWELKLDREWCPRPHAISRSPAADG
jgi:FkbH-like protein